MCYDHNYSDSLKNIRSYVAQYYFKIAKYVRQYSLCEPIADIMADSNCSNQSVPCLGYPGMERWKGRVAIVTGASAGIGYEIAKRLAQLGVVVVGCARNITAIQVSH